MIGVLKRLKGIQLLHLTEIRHRLCVEEAITLSTADANEKKNNTFTCHIVGRRLAEPSIINPHCVLEL